MYTGAGVGSETVFFLKLEIKLESWKQCFTVWFTYLYDHFVTGKRQKYFTLLALAIIFFCAITNFFGVISDPSSCLVIIMPLVTWKAMKHHEAPDF